MYYILYLYTIYSVLASARVNVCFVPKADVRRFYFWKFFCAKIGEGKRGRYYIDREADWIMTSKLYEPYLFSITISWACPGFGLF